LGRLVGSAGKRCVIGHPRPHERTTAKSRPPALNPGTRKLGSKAIGLFYDFRALMRSATSR
jgi:hypothetical protein